MFCLYIHKASLNKQKVFKFMLYARKNLEAKSISKVILIDNSSFIVCLKEFLTFSQYNSQTSEYNNLGVLLQI